MANKKISMIELNDEYINKFEQNMKNSPQSANLTINTIKQSIIDKSFDLRPSYQRNFIQSDSEASRFIESVFLGCTIPQVQLYENSDGVLEVVDGQQRLTSLINFRDNNLILQGLSELPELNGYTFEELPEKLKNKYGNFQIDAKIIRNSDPSFVFMVFERLNKGSKGLNGQEIRNCTNAGKLNELIIKLAKEDIVKELINMENSRFQLEEAILRALAVQEFYPKFRKAKLQDNLNEYMNTHTNRVVDDIFLEELEKEFLGTLKLIRTVLGTKAFYKNKKYSVAILETYMLNFQRFSKHDIMNNADELKESLTKLANTLTKNNTTKYIIERIEIVYDVMKSIIEKGVKVDSKRLFTRDEKQAIWNRDIQEDGTVRCSACGQRILDIDDAEVDHIVPYSKGGKTELDNGQLLHQHCNRVKNNQYEKEPQKMIG